MDAMHAQLEQFEHVIGANTTYPALLELAEQLKRLMGLSHVFFASDGSSAVEIALKLALHAMQLRGEFERRQVIALSNGYHGETIASLSVSDVACYKQPYEGLGLACHMIQNIPYVTGEDDPLWHDCSAVWPQVEAELEQLKATSCGVIVEPILQGAGGMKIYSADFLRRLRAWSEDAGCYLIADEIMTGVGRTGRWLASAHANIKPDLICLSKGLTAGTTPLSCVLVDDALYDLFYQHPGNPFLHSHTYTGHALGVAAALATLKMMEAGDFNARAVALGKAMKTRFMKLADETGCLKNIRSIGGMVAGDMVISAGKNVNVGREVARAALERGALLRPLGKTLYWLPPLTMDERTLDDLAEITKQALQAAQA